MPDRNDDFIHAISPSKEATASYFRAMNTSRPSPNEKTAEYIEKLRAIGYRDEEIPYIDPEGVSRFPDHLLVRNPDETESLQESIDESESEESEYFIPYEKFISNIEGYLAGYIFAKSEYEKLESERKPNRFSGKNWQDGFDHKNWKKYGKLKVKLSGTFRSHRNRAIEEHPEYSAVFDEFDETLKK